jgi:Flp pilus assembly pilin Flp
MIDSSAAYGLYNPAFTEDIGQAKLRRIAGNSIDDMDDYKISGSSNSISDINFQKALSNDKFESSTTKEKVIKGTLIGAGALIAGLAAWKFGLLGKLKSLGGKIPGVSKVGKSISGFFSSAGKKLKGLVPKSLSFKGFGTKIKGFSSSIGTKIKSIFKK